MDKMKISFKNITPEILDVLQKIKDRYKDLEITQESDKTFWFKGSAFNLLFTTRILLKAPVFRQEVCQWEYIDAKCPEYKINFYSKYISQLDKKSLISRLMSFLGF